MPVIASRLAAAAAAILALGLSACATHFAPVDPSVNWSQGNYDSAGAAPADGAVAQNADPAQKKKASAAH